DGSTSDGAGTVMLATDDEFDNGEAIWTAFDATGRRLGLASAITPKQPMPFPLDSGFQWFNESHSCSPTGQGCIVTAAIRQLSSSLQETSRTTLFESRFGPADPPPSQIMWGASRDAGGLVVTHVFLDHRTSWELIAQRFDSHGRATTPETGVSGGLTAQQPTFAVSGISRKGPILVLWNVPRGGALLGRWFDASGKSMTNPFVIAPAVSP